MKTIIERYNSRKRYAFITGILPAFFLFVPVASAEPSQLFTFFQAEQFEYRANDGGGSFNWDAQGWIGTDDHKAWLKTEGEKPTDGRLEKGEFQLLYSRRISNFFDAQVGCAMTSNPARKGVRRLLTAGTGALLVRSRCVRLCQQRRRGFGPLRAEYDLLITQKLILQPTAEVNLAVQSVRERGIGSGINDVELGLRLRYEIERRFAPYIGISWERKLGETADFARDEGEEIDNLSFVTGIRFSF
ncbi:MAG: copper resistance protein B [Alphaproteobacteria bacterium]|nr:copper resistance protein B [Alphaproteobacteria bacterium]